MRTGMKIGKRTIGRGEPVFIVAELSANHKQDYQIAEDSITAAYEAGADAVKLQTYTPDTITIDCDNELFRLPENSLWAGKTLYELYGEAYTPWEWHAPLKEKANALGMELFSSPFDPSAVDFLESLDMPAYKIASFEIFDIPLIRKAASCGRPMILSTGMAGKDEIEEAINACRSMGNDQIILLKCTSAYPAPLEQANLAMIPRMQQDFSVDLGLSDHTQGDIAAISAVALGAVMIEKHFILDRSLGGPDADFSMDPAEFAKMVKHIRDVDKSLGRADYMTADDVAPMSRLGRSLFAVKDIKAGEVLTEENVRSIRPGAGLHPRHFPDVLGRHARVNIAKGTPLHWDLLEGDSI